MEFDRVQVASAVLALILALYGLYRTVYWQYTLPYPPGPKGLPFVGSLFDPVAGASEYQWLAYKQLADKHST
jgi:hypothetical protein